MWFIVVLVAAWLTWYLPLKGKIIALAINFFIPEGVPYLDEVIQVVGIMKSLKK